MAPPSEGFTPLSTERCRATLRSRARFSLPTESMAEQYKEVSMSDTEVGSTMRGAIDGRRLILFAVIGFIALPILLLIALGGR